MKTRLAFLLLILAISSYSPSFGQFSSDLKGVDFKDRLLLGGYATVQFGNVTYLDLSPSAGYLVTSKYMTGIGLSFIYSKVNYTGGPSHESTWYGFRNFHRYNITEQLFAWGEIEFLNYEYLEPFSYTVQRIWYPAYYVGGGYMNRFPGGKGGVYITVLYNLNHGPESPYASPIVPRIGVFF